MGLQIEPVYTAQEERLRKIVDLYKSGKTLIQIGIEFGLSRERIRQLLASVGLTKNDGGRHVRSVAVSRRKEEFKVWQREALSQELFGCSYDEYVRITGHRKVYRRFARLLPSHSRILHGFWMHKNYAIVSNIPWLLTLPQYESIVGPYLTGRWRGLLALGRKDKTGPFSAENVHVTSLRQNSADTRAQEKSRAEQAKALRDLGLGLDEIAKSLRVSRHTVKLYLFAENNKEAMA